MSAENPSTPRKTRGFNKDGTPRKVRQKADTKEPKAMSQDANQDDEPKVEEQSHWNEGGNASASAAEIKPGEVTPGSVKPEKAKGIYQEDDSRPGIGRSGARAPNIDGNLAILGDVRKTAVVSRHQLAAGDQRLRTQAWNEVLAVHQDIRAGNPIAYMQYGGLQALSTAAGTLFGPIGQSPAAAIETGLTSTFPHPAALAPAVIESVLDHGTAKRMRPDEGNDESQKRLALSGNDGKPATSHSVDGT